MMQAQGLWRVTAVQTWDSTQMTAGLEDTWGYVSWVGGNQEHVDAMVTNCLQQHTLPCKHSQAHTVCSGHTLRVFTGAPTW